MSNTIVTRKQAQAIWSIFEKNKGFKNLKTTPYPGITFDIEYDYTFNCLYESVEVEVTDLNVRTSKELKKLEKVLGASFTDIVCDNRDWLECLPQKEVAALRKAFEKACQPIDKSIRRNVPILHHFDNFEEFWSAITEAVNKVNAPAPTNYKINNSYTATIIKGATNIKVGCQSIPVDTIRGLLAEIDKVNKQ